VGVTEILAEIDREIIQLQEARALLEREAPEGWKIHHSAPSSRTAKKRNLTPEGRKRIAEAVKRRWARQKSQSFEAAAAG
jgi:hypothetical protein